MRRKRSFTIQPNAYPSNHSHHRKSVAELATIECDMHRKPLPEAAEAQAMPVGLSPAISPRESISRENVTSTPVDAM